MMMNKQPVNALWPLSLVVPSANLSYVHRDLDPRPRVLQYVFRTRMRPRMREDAGDAGAIAVQSMRCGASRCIGSST